MNLGIESLYVPNHLDDHRMKFLVPYNRKERMYVCESIRFNQCIVKWYKSSEKVCEIGKKRE